MEDAGHDPRSEPSVVPVWGMDSPSLGKLGGIETAGKRNTASWQE